MKRKSLSIRTRFEVFKRDNFTCRYCGRKSPKVVLELDHVIAIANGGENDSMNLVTSCFECNSGKSDKNLSEIITGEDPHDKALELAEKERQISEYYAIRKKVEARIANEIALISEEFYLSNYWETGIKSMLREHDFYNVKDALRIAIEKKGRYAENIPYVWGILRNFKK